MNQTLLHIVLLGAPACGKGSLSALLAKHYHIRHVSTGNILREAVEEQTPLGIQAASLINAGHFVSDNIIMGLMQEELNEIRADGLQKAAPESSAEYFGNNRDPLTIVLYDGFPRTLPQAEAFDSLLAETGEIVDAVVFMECPEEVLLHRVKNRCVCPKCAFVSSLPKVSVAEDGKRHCPQCGHELIQRRDDQPEIFAERLNTFYKMTAPLVPYYTGRRKLVRVDSSKETEILEKEDIDWFIDTLLKKH